MSSRSDSGAAPKADALLDMLSRRYQAVLTRYFTRRGISLHDAQDLVQDVFVRLSRRDNLDDVEKPEGYIFAMAANALIDFMRRRHVRTEGIAALTYLAELDDELLPDRHMSGRQEIEAILASLNQMPERMRNIFILARIEHLTRAEIAQRLEISKSLVDQQIELATACLAERRRKIS